MSDIFISYASADRSRVVPLVDELQRRGWSVWWDRTIRPGKTWDQVIEAALDEARCVIVLWSRASVQSDWVRTEADEAKQRGILVPALIDDVVIPLAFRRMHAANLVQWSGALPSAEFDELIRAVAEVLSDDVPPAPEMTPRRARAHPPLPRPDPVPVTTRRRLGVLLIGAASLLVAASLALYLAASNREASKGPSTSSASGQLQEKSKAEPALPPPASSIPNVAVASRQPRNNAKDGLKYVWIPPGIFTMGCSPGDGECYDDEKPAHKVTITTGFWMGQTPVTQEAYQRVTGKDPSHFKGPQLPVETVNWNEAQSYCQAVGMRLPTEAEREYAARGGTTGSRYGNIDEIAWNSANSGGKTHEVGKKQPNAWGLYDMLGNVWQWTADWYAEYSGRSETDPHGPTSHRPTSLKTAHGGSWGSPPVDVRVSRRLNFGPEDGVSRIGLRCVEN